MSDKRETSDFYPNVRDGIITPINAETWVEQFEQHARAALASEENAAKSADAASDSATSAALYAKASSAGATDAETAKADAQAAQGKAEAAQASAETAQKGAESAKEAAASSATAAAQSAQAAADGVATLLQGKVEAAEEAKAGAEAAKTDAETAKTGAEAAKTAAASSATAAANSAAAAAKSATDLADAVATAKSLDGRLSAIEPSALRAKDVVISNNNTYADGAFSYNPAIETFYNTGTIGTGAYFLAYCTGLKWVYASHWDQIGSNAFRDCSSLTEVKGSVWRVANMNNDSSEIGAYAFANCTNLEKMPPVSNDIKTFESGFWAGVRIINVGAFYNCRKLPAQFVKDIISSPALWSIRNDVLSYCCLDSGGIDELVLGKNIVFNSFGAFAKSGVKRVDCSQMVKDPMFNNQFFNSLLEELILPQRQFSYYNSFSGLKYFRYVKMPPEEPVVLYGSHLFYKDNSFSSVDEITVEFPITRAEAEAWTKYQFIVLDSFPLEKTIFNFTDEQGVTYNA